MNKNEKNKAKRKNVRLIGTAHRHLRHIAAELDTSLEEALDHVVFEYARKHPVRVPRLREGEE